MICLTGDIHHSALGTGNQAHCDITEIQVADRYTRMLEEAGVKTTFFVSGRCFSDEWQDLKPVCDSPNVELGGHNWRCFTPSLWHRGWNKLINNYNGPAWYQRWDARKTIDIIRAKTGRRIICWRNHMYMHGPNTEKVLAGCGIRICSDGVVRASNGPVRHPSGLWNLPLNIIPDHEHLYHAERTPEWVAAWVKRYKWSDDYGPDSYHVEEWTDLVLAGLKRREDESILSNMIIHPITLYLADGLKSFERIVDYLSSRQTVFMSEIIPQQE